MNPATKRFYKEGEIMHRPKLANTLQVELIWDAINEKRKAENGEKRKA